MRLRDKLGPVVLYANAALPIGSHSTFARLQCGFEFLCPLIPRPRFRSVGLYSHDRQLAKDPLVIAPSHPPRASWIAVRGNALEEPTCRCDLTRGEKLLTTRDKRIQLTCITDRLLGPIGFIRVDRASFFLGLSGLGRDNRGERCHTDVARADHI